MNKIATSSKIFENVKFGNNITIEDFVIIGNPPYKKKDGELKTVIGDNSLIRSHSVLYAGNLIGDNFQTGNNVNIREENLIGNNVSIGTKTVIEFKTKIEDNVRIHSQAFIPEYCELKEGCWIGPNAVLTNAKYPISARSKEFIDGVIVGKGAIIGANSTILPGIKIGEYSLIGAGSVVTQDVQAKKVLTGNPARVIDDIDNLKYSDGGKAYNE